MRAQDAYTKTEYDKAEFLLIAADTEKSHMLKNTWLASLAMVPTYLAILSNITHIFNMETSDIWLSIGLFLFILYQYIHIYKIYKSYCFPHESCEVRYWKYDIIKFLMWNENFKGTVMKII